MNVNFFWKGNDFDDFNKICLLSHIKVGHNVILWLSGTPPNSNPWKEIEEKIIIKNADTVYDVNNFIKNGGNFQTASALWRFHFLFNNGGWYCDTDAFAIQHFPENEPWIICSAETTNDLLSIGIIKAPKRHIIFTECIENVKMKWGNVKIFTECYKTHFGNTNPTVNNKDYYPWKWNEWNTLHDNITINSLIKNNTKSIHLYHTALKRNNVKCEAKEYPCILNEMIEFTKGL